MVTFESLIGTTKKDSLQHRSFPSGSLIHFFIRELVFILGHELKQLHISLRKVLRKSGEVASFCIKGK
jgi:hypothetical protein